MLLMLEYFAASCQQKGITILPAWYKYVEGKTDGTGRCSLNFTFPNDVGLVLLAVVEILLRVAGMAAVAFIIYGGMQYLISQGEPDKVNGAKQTIYNALIGLLVAVFATAMVNFIGTRLAG
ncbi:hypothetical protein CR970_01110 [Candidatus Saccharibacteria bacterium]|nr:MAG: hypothetical protein CR970_01110 [Candidatus Saccharibacteria bacterium]